MPIAREVVLHVAELASLSLAEDEVSSLARDLDAIVRYVEQLGDVDTEGVLPATCGACAVSPSANPATSGVPLAAGVPGAWRPDVPEPGLSHEDALAQAPRAAEDGFAVPKFVDGSGAAGTSQTRTES